MQNIRKILVISFVLAVGLTLAASVPASASTIALWNYNGYTADNGTTPTNGNNPLTPKNPNADIGSGTQEQVGNLTSWGYNSGTFPTTAGDYSTDTVSGTSDKRYRYAQLTTGTGTGLLWKVPTTGYNDIQVQLGVFSQTAFTNRTWSFEYSTDGGSSWSDNSVTYTGGSSWSTFTINPGTAANDEASFWFRFISDQTSSATLTVDYIIVTGTAVPIPAAAWLLGSGLLGLVAIRRRMKK